MEVCLRRLSKLRISGFSEVGAGNGSSIYLSPFNFVFLLLSPFFSLQVGFVMLVCGRRLLLQEYFWPIVRGNRYVLFEDQRKYTLKNEQIGKETLLKKKYRLMQNWWNSKGILE